MSVDVHAGYALMVLLGAIVMLAFPLTRDLRSSAERRSYYVIQGITLLGALVGAKFAVLMGDALWPLQPYHDWPQLLVSGRSIAGALLRSVNTSSRLSAAHRSKSVSSLVPGWPFSIFEIVSCQMPLRAASSFCVSFFALRASRSAWPTSLGLLAICLIISSFFYSV